MTTADTEAQAIIDAARMGTDPHELQLGSYYVVRSSDGGIHEIDLTGDTYRSMPERKIGTVTLGDVPSFLHYVTRHADPDSEFFANRAASNVTCVLDAHMADPDGGARWQQHRAVLQFERHPVWLEWLKINGKYMPQSEFAEFLEDMRQWIAVPDAATMLEIAQTFQATTRVEFKSGTVVRTGQKQLAWVENTNAHAGIKGTLDIPDEIVLGLPVFRGSETVERVVARLRYRIHDGRLTLMLKLDQPQDVFDGAFRAEVDKVRTGLSQTTLQDMIMVQG